MRLLTYVNAAEWARWECRSIWLPVGALEDMIFDKPHKIAIVDDDDGVRDSLQVLLQAAGHVVETFASPAEFLRTDIRYLACLISDNHMEPMSGLDLIARLRAEGVRIPILLITATSSPAIHARAAKLGVERVLEKPASAQDLLNFVDSKLS